jgi:hypothetical protein
MFAYVGGIAVLAWMSGRLVLVSRWTLLVVIASVSFGAAAVDLTGAVVLGFAAVSLGAIGWIERGLRQESP